MSDARDTLPDVISAEDLAEIHAIQARTGRTLDLVIDAFDGALAELTTLAHALQDPSLGSFEERAALILAADVKLAEAVQAYRVALLPLMELGARFSPKPGETIQ